MSGLDSERNKEKQIGVEKDDKTYASYLQTIALVSFSTAMLEILIMIYRWLSDEIFPICVVFGTVSFVILLCAAYIGSMVAKGSSIAAFIDDFINGRSKGFTVTIMFFLHMILVTLFIFQDGGAKSSCLSSILLIDAGFGFYFSSKTKVKRGVVIGCSVFYLFTYILHLENGELVHDFTFEILPYFGTVILVLLTNEIINSQITKRNIEDTK